MEVDRYNFGVQEEIVYNLEHNFLRSHCTLVVKGVEGSFDFEEKWCDGYADETIRKVFTIIGFVTPNVRADRRKHKILVDKCHPCANNIRQSVGREGIMRRCKKRSIDTIKSTLEDVVFCNELY